MYMILPNYLTMVILTILFVYLFIVSVSITLQTKSPLTNIGWSLTSECETTTNEVYGSNRLYPYYCALSLGKSYTLTCKSSNVDGFGTSFILIESTAYCEDFLLGSEKSYNFTITGEYILRKRQLKSVT